MSQNSKYRLKYDQLRENNPTEKESSEHSSSLNGHKLHQNASTARNICFAWPNGMRKFYSYSYLVSGELHVDDDGNTILLNFTHDLVKLKGYNLEPLFIQLASNTRSLIKQDDGRYVSVADENDYSVIEIIATPLR